MAAKYIGIDVEDRFLKIVVMNGSKVTRTIQEVMPDNMVVGGRIAAFHALADYMREVVKRNKVRVRKAVVVLPSETYHIRRVRLPRMSARQLQINLPYEFHDYLQEDTDQYVFDYSVLSSDEKEMELLVAALSKSQVSEYKNMCKRAGLTLVKLVPDVLTVQRIVLPPEDPAVRKKRLALEEKEKARLRKEEAKAASEEKKALERSHRKSGLSVEELSERAAEEARMRGTQGSEADNHEMAAGTGLPIGSFGTGTASNAQSTLNGAAGSAGLASSGSVGGSAASMPAASASSAAFQDYAVLCIEYNKVKLHFYSNGAYEITRNLNINEKRACEVVAREKDVDIHIAQLMVDRNQDNVLGSEAVLDLLQDFATEVMRVINFYNYNNPRNNIDAIYYYGRIISKELVAAVEEVTGLPIRPLTDLLSDNCGEHKKDLQVMMQGYGAVLE